MKWHFENDNTVPVISAGNHIKSSHGGDKSLLLPEICVMFEMGMAFPYIEENYETVTLSDRLPCFLDNPKCISLKDGRNVCFTKGGYGAPAAVDTLETVIALGVKKIVIAGMCGGFGENINVGDIVIPRRVLCEEGTSRHYFSSIEYAEPDLELFQKAHNRYSDKFNIAEGGVVTSDAVYRQTFAKEAYWRSRGLVGVDMETSALLAVSKYYGIPAVSILLCSDKHPLGPDEDKWDFGSNNFKEIRRKFVRETVKFASKI